MAIPAVPEYLTVWVIKRNLKATGGEVGYVNLPKTDADALIADGSAVDPTKFDGYTLPYIEGEEPGGAAPAAAAKAKKPQTPTKPLTPAAGDKPAA